MTRKKIARNEAELMKRLDADPCGPVKDIATQMNENPTVQQFIEARAVIGDEGDVPLLVFHTDFDGNGVEFQDILRDGTTDMVSIQAGTTSEDYIAISRLQCDMSSLDKALSIWKHRRTRTGSYKRLEESEIETTVREGIELAGKVLTNPLVAAIIMNKAKALTGADDSKIMNAYTKSLELLGKATLDPHIATRLSGRSEGAPFLGSAELYCPFGKYDKRVASLMVTGALRFSLLPMLLVAASAPKGDPSCSARGITMYTAALARYADYDQRMLQLVSAEVGIHEALHVFLAPFDRNTHNHHPFIFLIAEELGRAINFPVNLFGFDNDIDSEFRKISPSIPFHDWVPELNSKGLAEMFQRLLDL